tara:strand:- start:413 stop:616 length:204 start_codon:yes stop_codon:yes gene_type:complete
MKVINLIPKKDIYAVSSNIVEYPFYKQTFTYGEYKNWNMVSPKFTFGDYKKYKYAYKKCFVYDKCEK